MDDWNKILEKSRQYRQQFNIETKPKRQYSDKEKELNEALEASKRHYTEEEKQLHKALEASKRHSTKEEKPKRQYSDEEKELHEAIEASKRQYDEEQQLHKALEASEKTRRFEIKHMQKELLDDDIKKLLDNTLSILLPLFDDILPPLFDEYDRIDINTINDSVHRLNDGAINIMNDTIHRLNDDVITQQIRTIQTKSEYLYGIYIDFQKRSKNIRDVINESTNVNTMQNTIQNQLDEFIRIVQSLAAHVRDYVESAYEIRHQYEKLLVLIYQKNRHLYPSSSEDEGYATAEAKFTKYALKF